MVRKKYLIIQDNEHEFHDEEGLLKIVDHAIKGNPNITYCRHVGFRFVNPEGLSAIRREFKDVDIEVRYVDEAHRWGKYYSPRQFVVGESCFALYSGDSLYLSEVQLNMSELKKKLENEKLGKQDINLVKTLRLENVLAFLDGEESGNAGEIASAWDYHVVMNGSGKGYFFDRYDAEAGRVNHHVSCFRGVSLIYIPLNKLFSSPNNFEAGLNYLKHKFTKAKKEGVLRSSDVRAIVIEAEPKPQYHW